MQEKLMPVLLRRGPITDALGAAKSSQAVAVHDHSGITPLLSAFSPFTVSQDACCSSRPCAQNRLAWCADIPAFRQLV